MNDRLRALDTLTPPDQWSDIVERAGTTPEAAPDEPHRRGLLMAAAIVVVLAGVAGGLVLARTGGDDGAAAFDDPSGIWGHRWDLTALTENGEERFVPATQHVPSGQGTLDLRIEGDSSFHGCNYNNGPVALDGDRLVASGDHFTTLIGCNGPQGVLWEQVDRLAAAVIDGGTVELSGSHLTLRSSSVVAEFEARPAEPVSPDIWGDEWDLTRLRFGEMDVPIPASGTGSRSTRPAGSPIFLDLRHEGVVSFTACGSRSGGATSVPGGLVVQGPFHMIAPDCGRRLEVIDELMTASLLEVNPRLRIEGAVLTLEGPEVVAEFHRSPVPDEDDGGPCHVDLDLPSPTAGVVPGPSDPAVYENPGFPPRGQVWHVLTEEQLVEVHVPIPAVMDLVGEQTEPIELENGYEGVLWFTEDFVQLRVADRSEPEGPCTNFSVTVSGLTRADVATYLGEHLILTEA